MRGSFREPEAYRPLIRPLWATFSPPGEKREPQSTYALCPCLNLSSSRRRPSDSPTVKIR